MEQETILKIEQSIKNLESRDARIYFLVQDTKGNAKAGIRFIYQMAKSLKDNGFNPIILHETKSYQGVADWMGAEYMEIPHNAIENQNLQISPEDIVVIPEIYGHVMEQISKLPCGKIVLCQAYDHMLETLSPGVSWSQYGFMKCITTSDLQKEHISKIMKNVSFDIVEPLIPQIFNKKEKPAKPIVCIHTREPRDTMKIVKEFYLKYPQYRWITFRDMRGTNQEEFARLLKESYVSVWVDDTSAFGTYPIESMASGTPVIGKVPNMKPDWMTDSNGVWTYEQNSLVDILAEFTQNWLEDNISDQLYGTGLRTAERFKDAEYFTSTVVKHFDSYLSIRKNSFQEQLDKMKLTESE